MSMPITAVVAALSQRKLQAALQSLDAICGDCPEPVCVQDPRSCPVQEARRALTPIFVADWVEPEPAVGGCCGSGGCGSGGCSRA